MARGLKVLGIPGSLRKNSYNRAALRAAQELAPEGMEIDIFPLDDVPGFNEDHEQNPPAAVVELKRRVGEADAILFATPEYNYSIPGVLKNAIDWGSRPYGQNVWDGKPAAIMGVTIGTLGTARAQYHLRQVMVNLNMYPLNQPEVMIGGAGTRFDSEGKLTDEPTREHIRKQLDALSAWTRRMQQ